MVISSFGIDVSHLNDCSMCLVLIFCLAKFLSVFSVDVVISVHLLLQKVHLNEFTSAMCVVCTRSIVTHVIMPFCYR
jgi:hypothetical protein